MYKHILPKPPIWAIATLISVSKALNTSLHREATHSELSPHLLDTACLITTHLSTDGWPWPGSGADPGISLPSFPFLPLPSRPAVPFLPLQSLPLPSSPVALRSRAP